MTNDRVYCLGAPLCRGRECKRYIFNHKSPPRKETGVTFIFPDQKQFQKCEHFQKL